MSEDKTAHVDPSAGGGSPPEDPNAPTHFAYTVKQDRNGQNHWTKLGAAWPDIDGGYSVQMDAMPVDGRISLRPREALERLRADKQRQLASAPQQDKTRNP